MRVPDWIDRLFEGQPLYLMLALIAGTGVCCMIAMWAVALGTLPR
ncbi:MAG: hypothetical protein ACFB51_11780 [Anaerolineae bacterium]